MMNLLEICTLLNCEPLPAIPITDVTIDSRQVKPGSLFVALKGIYHNGHDFIADARERGAVAALVEEHTTAIPYVLNVPDCTIALATIAKAHRQRIHCPIIALTGSNGKTSVKEMIACILPKPSLATKGNLNNHLGVPLSVLALNLAHQYAVFECGANHKGEIANSVAVIQPDVGLINNIGPAHIEGFGGSLDAVATAKAEMYAGLEANKIAIVNQDDAYAQWFLPFLNNKKVMYFSLSEKADVYASDVHFGDKACASFMLHAGDEECLVQLQVPGEHAIRNALAAAACCLAVGLSLKVIAQGLSSFQGVGGRLAYLPGKNGAVIIDDSYNANLRSVLAALDVLAQCSGKRLFVLGDLGELGAFTQEHHEIIGRTAKEKGIDKLFTCGVHSAFSTQAFGEEAMHYSDQEILARDLISCLDKETTVLVKGSRAAAMDNVVRAVIHS